jgi:hypothetical protein
MLFEKVSQNIKKDIYTHELEYLASSRVVPREQIAGLTFNVSKELNNGDIYLRSLHGDHYILRGDKLLKVNEAYLMK